MSVDVPVRVYKAVVGHVAYANLVRVPDFFDQTGSVFLFARAVSRHDLLFKQITNRTIS